MIRIFLLFIILSLLSCSSSDEESDDMINCRLDEILPGAMFYEYSNINNDVILFSDPGQIRIKLFYSDNGVLDSIKGGLIDFGGFTFNDNVTYKFSYINNEILVEHLAGTSTTSTYKIEEGKIISRIYNPNYNQFTVPREFHYVYEDNVVNEFLDGILFRTYHLTNNNLTKVDEFIYNLESPPELIRKKEITFSDFDNSPNLLKGQFHIDGAFYKAFSENNYTSIGARYYDFNGQNFVLNPNYIFDGNFSLSYNENGISTLFIQDCDF